MNVRPFNDTVRPDRRPAKPTGHPRRGGRCPWSGHARAIANEGRPANPDSPCDAATRAFTLIELMISAAVMSLILSSAYLCFSASHASQKVVEARSEVIQSARVAMELICADLRSACPLAPDTPFLGMHRMLGEVEADNLDFATHHYSPRRPREADFCEVSYFVQPNPQTGRFSLWRRRNPTIALDPLKGGWREELVEGLRRVRFEYYDGFEWYDTWGDVDGRGQSRGASSLEPGNLEGMPEAVRITLWFDPSPAHRPAEAGESSTNQLPLVFQTVARLELASSSGRYITGGVTNTPGSSVSPAANPTNVGP